MDQPPQTPPAGQTPPPQQTPPLLSEHSVKPEHRKLMSVLAYLGILIVIPFIMAKYDPTVKFHIKQGLVLFVIEAVVWMISTMMLGSLFQLLRLVNFFTLVLAIVGIVNVVQDKQKELPLVGSFAKHFAF